MCNQEMYNIRFAFNFDPRFDYDYVIGAELSNSWHVTFTDDALGTLRKLKNRFGDVAHLVEDDDKSLLYVILYDRYDGNDLTSCVVSERMEAWNKLLL